MCVAVIVQSEKPLSKEYLKAMHEANPHGGGVAWIDGDFVHFRKGLTWEDIHHLQSRLPRPFLMHFRIATRGGKIPELTHPFPLGLQAFEDDLTGMSDKGVLIHNGTWPEYRKYLPKGLEALDTANKISDTQTAAYMAAFDEDILKDVRWSNAIMKPTGVWYRGNWEKLEDNLYSNLHWRRELYTDWENWRSYYGSRTWTPYDTRKRGDTPSHQQGRSQENGRTVGSSTAPSHQRSVGQYQTQYSKSGTGTNTVQSNGKTLAENRAAKREKQKKLTARTKTQPAPSVTYEDAVKTYNDRKVPRNHSEQNSWEGERLFSEKDIPGFKWNSEGQLCKARTESSETVSYQSRARTVDFSNKPSVKCDDCNEEIEEIPCPCALDNAETVKIVRAEASDTVSVKDCMASCGACSDESECGLIGFDDMPVDDGVPHTVTDNVGAPYTTVDGDLLDVEDMNAYGMSLGLDEMPHDMVLSGDSPEDWKKVDDYIRKQGIKI